MTYILYIKATVEYTYMHSVCKQAAVDASRGICAKSGNITVLVASHSSACCPCRGGETAPCVFYNGADTFRDL